MMLLLFILLDAKFFFLMCRRKGINNEAWVISYKGWRVGSVSRINKLSPKNKAPCLYSIKTVNKLFTKYINYLINQRYDRAYTVHPKDSKSRLRRGKTKLVKLDRTLSTKQIKIIKLLR